MNLPRTLAALAVAALVLIPALASAQSRRDPPPPPPPPLQAGAVPESNIGGPPYVEALPGNNGGYRLVLVRFPSPVVAVANGLCEALNYPGGPKVFGTDGRGNISWIICAYR